MARTSAYTRSRALSKRITRALWACGGFFAIGYFPMALFGNPVAPMAIAACATIPFGSTARSVVRGLLRGLGLGVVAGLAVFGVLVRGRILPEAYVARLAAGYVFGTAAMCGVVGALFAHVARKRRRRIDEEWRE
jgi:hypothetical protein